MMLVGYMAEAACAGVAMMLMTMHFCLGHIYGHPGWTSHHIYLLVVSVSLLALSPCGRSFSWDRYRALAQARIRVSPARIRRSVAAAPDRAATGRPLFLDRRRQDQLAVPLRTASRACIHLGVHRPRAEP